MSEHNRFNEIVVSGGSIQDIHNVTTLRESYVCERNGNFSDSRLAAEVGSLSVGTLMLLPAKISRVDTTGMRSPSVYLNEMRDLSGGRKCSRTEVKFGQMSIVDSAARPLIDFVAAKYMHRANVAREFAASCAINQRFGERVSFQPIGFLKDANGRSGLLTRYEHGVVTLDNILWNRAATSEQRKSAISQAAIWMAQLHDHGIIHGDAQPKNIAYDSSGRSRYVDLESAYECTSGGLSPEINKLFDVTDFTQSVEAQFNPEELMLFIDQYMNAQGGRYPLEEIELMEAMASDGKESPFD